MQPNPIPELPVNVGSFLPFAVDAVTYDGQVCGIPTLVCSNFLAQMTSSSGKGADILIGNFRGSWTLPEHFLSAYISKYGSCSMDDAWSPL